MTFTVNGTAVTGAPAGWAAGQDDNPLDDQPIYEALVVGSIKAFDAVGSGSTAGSSYTNGTYDNVALNGGSGKNARAKLVIASGALSTITLTVAGEGYKDNEELTFDDADVGGGGGSGAKCKINGVNVGSSGPTAATTDQPPKLTITGSATQNSGANGSGGGGYQGAPLADQSKVQYTIRNNGGDNGTNGTVDDKAVTGGAGSGMKVKVTISGKVATKVELKTAGTGYCVGDVLTISKSDTTTDEDVTVVIGDPWVVKNVGIKVNGGTKSGLSDKSDVATTGGSGTGLKVNLFISSNGENDPFHTRASVEAAGSGYFPYEEVTVAKANAGTDNDVKLIVY